MTYVLHQVKDNIHNGSYIRVWLNIPEHQVELAYYGLNYFVTRLPVDELKVTIYPKLRDALRKLERRSQSSQKSQKSQKSQP
jgi:alpha-galactosidase/6-phospho-beta-glucosidase family protein